MRTAALLALLAIAAPVAFAQEAAPTRSVVSPDAAASALDEMRDEPVVPPAPPFQELDPASRELVVKWFRRYQSHQIESLEHRERLFRWQLRANQTSFVVVLVVVFAGIVFSGIQFANSLRARPGEAEASVHELSIGAQGVSVKSSVIGLIVLTISLGFFYLYLVHVFPLEELPPSGGVPAAGHDVPPT
jgi:hypothetical protein